MAGKSDRGRRVVDKDKDRDDSKSDRGLVIKDNDRDDKRSGRGREREREDDKARDRDRDKRRDGDRDDKTVLRNKKVVRELELAGDEQELSIFCGTWNLHGKEPPSDLTVPWVVREKEACLCILRSHCILTFFSFPVVGLYPAEPARCVRHRDTGVPACHCTGCRLPFQGQVG
jgi:hypothetical protein